VADASHELRTPLTSLRLNLELLARRDVPQADAERARRDLVAQVDDLTQLVGDLIEVARDEEPAPSPPEELDLAELVAGEVRRARAAHPGVRFAVELEPTPLVGHPERLARAVANLLVNAARWSPEGGTVEVRLAGRELTVRDHGPGIPAEDRPHVFERFYRAPDARSRPGSGLGLAIVRAVAEAHGGWVRAEEAPGGGALLRLGLPGSQPIQHPLSSPSHPAARS